MKPHVLAIILILAGLFLLVFGVIVLTVLLSILGVIDFSPRNQPVVLAVDALKSAYLNPYLLLDSYQAVTFAKGTAIARGAITERAQIGIDEEQLCLSLGDLSGSPNFEGTTQMITYTGSAQMDAKFSVLCAPGSDLLSLVGEGKDYPDIKAEWASGCECVTDPALAEKTCCLIALRYVT
ncbi:MAG: hypothetical protein V1493_06270 [Candidatus Diapherotrites archaeon]